MTTWMKLEDIMLSEICQAQKVKYTHCTTFTHIKKLKKKWVSLKRTIEEWSLEIRKEKQQDIEV